MKKLLLILAIISFAISIFYFHFIWSITLGTIAENEFYKSNYFVDMFEIFIRWTKGKVGFGWFPICTTLFGIVLLAIRKNLDKLISDFHRGYVDAMSDD